MNRCLAALAALASAITLSACVTQIPVHQAMPTEARLGFVTTDVVLPIKQEEIYIFVPASQVAASGGGGLLLALIDAGVNSNNAGTAEEAIIPLRNALVDFDFDQVIQADLKAALSQSEWLHAGNFQIIKENTTEKLDALMGASKASAVMFVATDYSLNWSGDTVSVSIYPHLFPKTTELSALVSAPSKSGPLTSSTNALYRNVLTVRDRAPDASEVRETNLVAWSEQNAAAMRGSLKRAATKLAEMLIADLHAPTAPIDAKTTKLRKIMVDNAVGYVVKDDAEGSLVQFPSGAQTYLTKAAQAALPKASSRPKTGAQAGQKSG